MYKKYIIIVFSIGFLFCSNQKRKFTKLEKPKKDQGIVYILRASSPLLMLYDIDIIIFKYKDHFKEKEKFKIYDFSLASGEFTVLKLNNGFYEITFSNYKDYSHIFYIKEEEILFKNIEIFSTSFFSLPDIVIKDLNKEEAVKYLLEFDGMYKKLIQ